MKLFFALALIAPIRSEENYEAFMHKMEAEFDPTEHMSDDNLFKHMNPDGSRTLQFNEPGRDTEDGGAVHMPNMYRCDACRIVAMFITDALEGAIDKVHSIKSGEKELPESEIIDTIDDLCNKALKTFEKVGLKTVNGVKRVNAPGWITDGIPGVSQHGQFWPQRFRTMCNGLVGQMEDEMEIYNIVRGYEGNGLKFEMCFNGKKKDCFRYPTDSGPSKNVKTEL